MRSSNALNALIAAGVALVIIGLIIFGVMRIVNTNTSTNKKSTTTSQSQQQKGNSNTQSSQGGTNQPAPAPGSKAQSQSTPAPTTGSASSDLTKTGPADAFKVFAIATILGTLTAYGYQAMRRTE